MTMIVSATKKAIQVGTQHALADRDVNRLAEDPLHDEGQHQVVGVRVVPARTSRERCRLPVQESQLVARIPDLHRRRGERGEERGLQLIAHQPRAV